MCTNNMYVLSKSNQNIIIYHQKIVIIIVITYFFLSPGSTDPAVLAVTSSEEGKRQTYIHELINTEETYMEDMSVVMDVSHLRICFVYLFQCFSFKYLLVFCGKDCKS